MCVHDRVLFCAREGRARDGPAFWELSVGVDSGSVCAQLFHGKNRFWLQRRGCSECDFGFSFIPVAGRHTVRAFRAVLPREPPYIASSPETELSVMAKQGTADPGRFIVYASKHPERGPDGRLVLRFGDVYVVASVKNFLVDDEDNNRIFMIYRSSSGMCTVQAREPITPMMAFGWAIAVITKGN
jgi:hypothetical protein